jgi:hypothetical protein
MMYGGAKEPRGAEDRLMLGPANLSNLLYPVRENANNMRELGVSRLLF